MRTLLFIFVFISAIFVSCDRDFNYLKGEPCNEEKRGELGECCLLDPETCKDYPKVVCRYDICIEYDSGYNTGADDLIPDN